MTLVIRNARILDGTGKPAFSGDVVCEGETICDVLQTGRSNAPVNEQTGEINASGLSLAPGFIDVHSHSDFSLLADARGEGKIAQGVTLDIGGNCGLAAAPLFGEAAQEKQKSMEAQFGGETGYTFASVGELLGEMEREKRGLHFAALCGYNALRASVTGVVNRPPSETEWKIIEEKLTRSFEEGATGLSLGMIYPPVCYAGKEELIRAARFAHRFGRRVSVHIRNEGNRLLEAVEEVIKIAEASGASLQISHLKTAGRQNHHKVEKLFKLIETARQKGVDIGCDRYPYCAAKTGLIAILPSWSYEGGRAACLKRLQNRQERKKIAEWIEQDIYGDAYWETVMVSELGNSPASPFIGKRLAELAGEAKKKPVDFLLDLLTEEKLEAEGVYFSMSRENMHTILSKPYVVAGSDAAARCFDGCTAKGKPHPRTYGSFPRFFSEMVQGGFLTEEEAIRKMTSQPAELFKLQKRGRITKGYYADIVLFHAGEFSSSADYHNPFQKPKGVESVFLKGKLSYHKNRLYTLSGDAVRC